MTTKLEQFKVTALDLSQDELLTYIHWCWANKFVPNTKNLRKFVDTVLE